MVSLFSNGVVVAAAAVAFVSSERNDYIDKLYCVVARSITTDKHVNELDILIHV